MRPYETIRRHTKSRRMRIEESRRDPRGKRQLRRRLKRRDRRRGLQFEIRATQDEMSELNRENRRLLRLRGVRMNCPFCGSDDIDIPTVDIGVGEQQCAPAGCLKCQAYQDMEGRWHCPACQSIGFSGRIGTTAVGEKFQGCGFCVNEDGKTEF